MKQQRERIHHGLDGVVTDAAFTPGGTLSDGVLCHAPELQEEVVRWRRSLIERIHDLSAKQLGQGEGEGVPEGELIEEIARLMAKLQEAEVQLRRAQSPAMTRSGSRSRSVTPPPPQFSPRERSRSPPGAGRRIEVGRLHLLSSREQSELLERKQEHDDWVKRMELVEHRLQEMKSLWGVSRTSGVGRD